MKLSEIEPETSRQEWLDWFEMERGMVRERFGDDPEALELWPDDYYERMVTWWSTDNRVIDPITVYRDRSGIVRIEDGNHRVAISHLLELEIVPVIWLERPR